MTRALHHPPTPISAADVLRRLPAEWPEDLLPAIRAEIEGSGSKLIVLDDDPTGTQTVRNVPVLTRWDVELLTAELNQPGSTCYILTNSRSLGGEEARRLASCIVRNLMAASARTGRPVRVLSRSDSTLRGHFPDETEGIVEALGFEPDALVLAPFFLEGGRLTIGDVHYVREGEDLVPAGMTEFARDPAFGYRSSNLREWVVEKTGGRIRPEQVDSLSLEEIRQGGPDRVLERLLAALRGKVWIVNAAAMSDVQVVALALLRAERYGLKVLCRTAASFVPAYGGLEPAALLDGHDFSPCGGGGLILVGSFVPRTTRQLAELLAHGGCVSLELEAAALLDPEKRPHEVDKAGEFASRTMAEGRHAVIYTSRQVIHGRTREESLVIQRTISQALIEVVRRLEVRPRFLVAKGGITASDVATEGLGVVRAEVLGPIVPGVPVWKLGPESRFPGMPLVVFPGNVGGPESLVETLRRLDGQRKEDAPC
jgi:uncharacterized protein YgbK (DUF1537 family)